MVRKAVDEKIDTTVKKLEVRILVYSLICVVVFTVSVLWFMYVPSLIANKPKGTHKKRSLPLEDGVWMGGELTQSYNHSTVYSSNLWYRYARYIAKGQNRSECYVCTFLPLAVSTPRVVPSPVPNLLQIIPDTLISRHYPKILSIIVWSEKRAVTPRVTFNTNRIQPQYKIPERIGHKPLFGPVHIRPGTKSFLCKQLIIL